jgi:hypothetical protein
VLPAPPLRLLLRLKLRGRLRQQWRRMQTPRGAALTLLGVLLFGAWFAMLAFSLLGSGSPAEPLQLEQRVRVVALLFTLLTCSSALAHRGLFLAREEIERLFSAPVRRADLVRYRLLSSSFRNGLGGLLIALVSMRGLPRPTLAFLGILLSMQTLPVLNQIVAIGLGGLESRAAEALRRLAKAVLVLVLLAIGALVFHLVTERSPAWLAFPGQAGGPGSAALLAHPLLRWVTLPFVPWARMITAGSPAEFWPWFLACLTFFVLLFELCARLPFDFRELSLATAARVAARLARARRGGGAAAGRASARAARWNVPWIFGRSPTGAIAWRKSASIVRKASSTFWVSFLVLVFVSLLSGLALGEDELSALVAPGLVATLGTFYLSSGLRFDFREDLERMASIRSWPLSCGRIFFATLLPQVLLVSSLLIGAVLLQAAATGEAHPIVLGSLPCLPLLVLGWMALDNALFLFAPVRIVPGHEGALQNAGRGLLLLFLRAVVSVPLATLVAAAGWGGQRLSSGVLGWEPAAAAGAGFFALWMALLLVDVLLVWAGGRVLRGFDLARDTG